MEKFDEIRQLLEKFGGSHTAQAAETSKPQQLVDSVPYTTGINFSTEHMHSSIEKQKTIAFQ